MGTRRHFLGSSAALAGGFASLARALSPSGAGPAPAPRRAIRGDLGPPVADPRGWLELPAGFEYTLISRKGEEMDDGFIVPRNHDGMAAFAAPDGKTLLVRNHEDTPGVGGPFGEDNRLLERLEDGQGYDLGRRRQPCRGGTTTLVFDTATQRLEEHWLSLAATLRNCSGGPTPWGTWLTCEEAIDRAGDSFERDHGFVFEVDPAHRGLAEPRPLEGLGRFNHEAVAIDPASGAAYLTEDRPDGLFYRYLPKTPGDLHGGGTLEALMVDGAPALDTRNWHALTTIPRGTPLPVRWVALSDVLAPADDLRERGFVDGAARFARGEGAWYSDGKIYFACTSGGAKGVGQVFSYTPSEHEGTRRERRDSGLLELICQPDDRAQLDMCDNLTMSPWGDLILCEDGLGPDRLVGMTPDGEVYPFASNVLDESELTGVVFSPDGTTLFVNMQGVGATVAITGPWPEA